MNHLMVGAAVPFLVALVIYVRNRCRATFRMLLLAPLAMFLCATWAVLPDLPRTFGWSGYEHSIAQNPKIDIFFLHYTINQHETVSPWYSVGFVLMLLGVFLAAWRELKIAERN